MSACRRSAGRLFHIQWTSHETDNLLSRFVANFSVHSIPTQCAIPPGWLTSISESWRVNGHRGMHAHGGRDVQTVYTMQSLWFFHTFDIADCTALSANYIRSSGFCPL